MKHFQGFGKLRWCVIQNVVSILSGLTIQSSIICVVCTIIKIANRFDLEELIELHFRWLDEKLFLIVNPFERFFFQFSLHPFNFSFHSFFSHSQSITRFFPFDDYSNKQRKLKFVVNFECTLTEMCFYVKYLFDVVILAPDSPQCSLCSISQCYKILKWV